MKLVMRKVGWILFGTLVVLAIPYFLPAEDQVVIWLRNGVYLLTPLIAIVAGFFTVRAYGFPSEHSRNFMLIIAGLGLWFVGEVIFSSYTLAGIDPYPSIADIFYLLAYPFLMVGFYWESRSLKARLSSGDRVLFAVFCLLTAAVVFYTGVFRAFDPELPFANNFVAITYGLADLILLIATARALLLARTFHGGSLSKAWIALFAATLIIMIADIIYSLYNVGYDAGLAPYYLMDLLWMIGYVLYAYGFIAIAVLIRSVQGKIQPRVSK